VGKWVFYPIMPVFIEGFMFVTCNTYTFFLYVQGLNDNIISCAFFAAVEAPQYDIVKWALFYILCHIFIHKIIG